MYTHNFYISYFTVIAKLAGLEDMLKAKGAERSKVKYFKIRTVFFPQDLL